MSSQEANPSLYIELLFGSAASVSCSARAMGLFRDCFDDEFHSFSVEAEKQVQHGLSAPGEKQRCHDHT